jgi:SAM-dependent methyltransferase
MTDQPTAKSMWEERYDADHYVYGTEPNEFLRDNVSMLSMGDVLCLAEGEGRNAVFLAGTERRVSSVDLSEAGVTKTLRLAGERGVEVDARVGDLSTYDLGKEKWDGIVSISAHMPAKVRADLHHRVVDALRPGGTFLLEAYTPNQIGRGTGGPQSVEMMMTLSALERELTPLEFLHAEETERFVVEGTGHTGSAAVVQVIARKAI